MPASRKTRNSSASSQSITTKKRKPKSRVGGKYNPRRNNYGIYIYRVVKDVHPNLGITKKAMGILNSFCLDTLTRVGNEASILCNYMGKKTLQVKDVESAVKLVFPKELGDNAIKEGNAAVKNFLQNSV
mmetsp:Transcript_21643/g.26664  ORF Transcript_21643/g.26664 Transcript_21643/m.26664 type:complete len:129 (+) Transcript_21643:57-443(+)